MTFDQRLEGSKVLIMPTWGISTGREQLVQRPKEEWELVGKFKEQQETR